MLDGPQELIPKHSLQQKLSEVINRDQKRQIDLPPSSQQLYQSTLIFYIMQFIKIYIQSNTAIIDTGPPHHCLVIELQFHFPLKSEKKKFTSLSVPELECFF
jgi:hypothetical protein